MMDGNFETDARSRVRQIGRRGHYDRATVYAVIDAGLVAHVAFIDNNRPAVIPMTYGRDGDRLYLHGSRKSRIATTLPDQPVSIGITLVDGIVVGRSMFETSMNYRSVVIHGRARWMEPVEERLRALRCVSDHFLPGRWDEVRAPLDNEIKATGVLEVDIEAASAKIRQGPPLDDYEDFDRRTWVGVLPVCRNWGEPLGDPAAEIPLPGSVQRRLALAPERMSLNTDGDDDDR